MIGAEHGQFDSGLGNRLHVCAIRATPRIMGNERRLSILNHLVRQKAISVGQLAVLLDIGQSALSQHLAVLRREGIVETRSQAQTVFYSLHFTDVARLISILSASVAVAA